jgi:hypothetical protein
MLGFVVTTGAGWSFQHFLTCTVQLWALLMGCDGRAVGADSVKGLLDMDTTFRKSMAWLHTWVVWSSARCAVRHFLDGP